MMGDDYTIVDMSIFPLVRNLIGHYGAADLVEISDFPNVRRTLEAFLARPAVERGLKDSGGGLSRHLKSPAGPLRY